MIPTESFFHQKSYKCRFSCEFWNIIKIGFGLIMLETAWNESMDAMLDRLQWYHEQIIKNLCQQISTMFALVGSRYQING